MVIDVCCSWLVVSCCVCCLLFVVCCLLCAACRPLFGVRCLSCLYDADVRASLLVVGCRLFVVRRVLLFVVRCL